MLPHVESETCTPVLYVTYSNSSLIRCLSSNNDDVKVVVRMIMRRR
jgi:hypothetical protein